MPAAEIPKDRTPIRRARKEAAVGTERDVPHRRGIRAERRPERRTGRSVPNEDAPRVRAGGDQTSIGADVDPIDGLVAGGKSFAKPLPGSDLPRRNRTGTLADDERATVGGERHRCSLPVA